jgi:hypothetical protein
MPTDVTPSFAQLIQSRADELKDWLTANAPEAATEQRHLDEGTRERAYWHYGYVSALQDVLRLLATGDQPKM